MTDQTYIATIDDYSLAAVPITMFFGDTKLGTGTAFFWHHNGFNYLVTNWHNVSGRHFETKKHLSKTAAEPNRLDIAINPAGTIAPKLIAPLAIRDGEGQPMWWVHPTLGSDVDIAVLPIASDARFNYWPINTLKSAPMHFAVGMDVFVLGYPTVLLDGFPIWKRGSMASEPEATHDDQRYILIDTASRPGMSGSPVILREWNSYMSKADDQPLQARLTPGPHTRFVGIYSGRLGSDDLFDTQLGMVWPAALIDEVVRGRRVDSA